MSPLTRPTTIKLAVRSFSIGVSPFCDVLKQWAVRYLRGEGGETHAHGERIARLEGTRWV